VFLFQLLAITRFGFIHRSGNLLSTLATQLGYKETIHDAKHEAEHKVHFRFAYILVKHINHVPNNFVVGGRVLLIRCEMYRALALVYSMEHKWQWHLVS